MQSEGVLSLVSRSNAWLSERQSAIARNVANVNTPGYKAVDVKPFAEVLATVGNDLARSHPGHLAIETAALAIVADAEEGSIMTHSGNSVSLEEQMLKAGDVAGKFALGTSVYKSFHRMITSAAR